MKNVINVTFADRNRDTLNAKHIKYMRERRSLIKNSVYSASDSLPSRPPITMSNSKSQEFECAAVLASMRSQPKNLTVRLNFVIYHLFSRLHVLKFRGQDDEELIDYESEVLESIRIEHNEWASIWGGVHNWIDHLSASKHSINQWSHTIADHANKGRLILTRLRMIDDDLPGDSRLVKHLWEQYWAILHMLAYGIGILDATLSQL